MYCLGNADKGYSGMTVCTVFGFKYSGRNQYTYRVYQLNLPVHTTQYCSMKE